MRIFLQMEQYNFSSGKSGTGAAISFDKNLLFPGRAWVLKLGNNKHGWRICSGVLKFCWMVFDAFHFIEEDDLPMHVFYGNINCPEKFESVSWVFQTNSTLLYSIDEFQGHFCKKRR